MTLAYPSGAGRALTCGILLDITVSRELSLLDRLIDIQDSHLRKKIKLDPKRPQVIKTIHIITHIVISQVKKT